MMTVYTGTVREKGVNDKQLLNFGTSILQPEVHQNPVSMRPNKSIV